VWYLQPFVVILAINIKVPIRPHVPLGFVSAAAKDGLPYYTNIPTTHFKTSNNSPTHPLASFHKWPWLCPPSTPHFTRAAHLPTPCQRKFVCETCTGTAQVGTSLVTPLNSLFKRSGSRSQAPRDIILVFVT